MAQSTLLYDLPYGAVGKTNRELTGEGVRKVRTGRTPGAARNSQIVAEMSSMLS